MSKIQQPAYLIPSFLSPMELPGESNPWTFVDEERRNKSLPRGFLFDDDDDDDEDDCRLASARTSGLSAASIPVLHMSPGPSWSRSPMCASPSPSPSRPLLYHCLASLHHSEGNIYSITVTKHFIFTGSSGTRIHVWAQPDCIEMGCIKSTSGEIRAILAYGKLLFTTHGDRRVRVWEISSFPPKKVVTLPKRRSFFSYPKKKAHQHRDSITCLAYNSKEKILYTGSWDQTVHVWRFSEKHCIDSFIAHESRVNAIVIDQDDGCVFTCSSDGKVKVWRRVMRESTHILTTVLKFQPSSINALALSLKPSEGFLYAGSSDGLVNFWEKETNSGRYNHGGFLQGHHFAVLCLETIGDLILSGSEDATVRIWKRDNSNSYHSSLAVIDGHHGPVRCLAAALETNITHEGLLVYSASLDQTLKVWRVKVIPTEKMNTERSQDNDQQVEDRECNMSPVLSPSWVQKKIHARDS